MVLRPAPTSISWWGPKVPVPQVRTLWELAHVGTASIATLAGLAALVEAGLSLCVVAEESNAGKTTMLTALLSAIPPSKELVEVSQTRNRMNLEASTDSVFLIGEVSPHHPAYFWGQDAEFLLRALRHNRQVLTTAHARDGAGFIEVMANAVGLEAVRDLRNWPVVVALDNQRRATDPSLQEVDWSHICGVWEVSTTSVGTEQQYLVGGDADRPAVVSALRGDRFQIDPDTVDRWINHITQVPDPQIHRSRPSAMLAAAMRSATKS